MRDIASHIYDITENSINAGASLIELCFVEAGNEFRYSIKDNGCGMDEEMVEAVKDPFVTTRTTRKVGLGIPLLIQNCEATGGKVLIESEVGKGTKLDAIFNNEHLDCPPLGDIADVMVNLAIASSDVEFVMEYTKNEGKYVFDTREVKDALDGVLINNLEVVNYLKEMVHEQLASLGRGGL